MTSFPLLLFCLFGLIAGVRGTWYLLKVKKVSHDAERTSHIITHILLSSMWLAAVLAISLLLPLFLERLVGLFAHTHPEQGDMLHQFVGYLSTTFALAVSFSILIIYLAWSWGRLLWQWWQIRGSLQTLQSLQAVDALDASRLWQQRGDIAGTFCGPILLVPGAWSVLVGVRHPKLLLGTELLSILSPKELQALLAHEEAHRQRKDPLYRVLLLFCSRLLPWLGHRLFKQWSESVEKICDQIAANHVNDPLLVATALIRTQRLQLRAMSSFTSVSGSTPSPNVIGFAQQPCIEARVHRLLALDLAHQLPTPPHIRHFLTRKMAILILLLPYPLHHTLEYLFSFLR